MEVYRDQSRRKRILLNLEFPEIRKSRYDDRVRTIARDDDTVFSAIAAPSNKKPNPTGDDVLLVIEVAHSRLAQP